MTSSFIFFVFLQSKNDEQNDMNKNEIIICNKNRCKLLSISDARFVKNVPQIHPPNVKNLL